MIYYLTNRGSRPCILFGYPGVAALDAAGRIVQHPAVRSEHPGTSGTVRPGLVRLGPGGSVQFLVTSVDTVPNPDCATSFPATTLQVYPAGQTTALRLHHRMMICDLEVGAVTTR